MMRDSLDARVSALLYAFEPQEAQSSVLRFASGTAHVWRFSYAPAMHAVRRASALLSPSELAAASRFATSELRDRCSLRRAFVRSVLARYVGTAARELTFESSRRGKPALTHLTTDKVSVTYSLSHTDDEAWLAVAHGVDVGIDVERLAANIDPDALERIVLAPDEAAFFAALSAASADERKRAFLRIWCRKEACLKATGVGLLDDLTSLSVMEDEVDLGACKDPRVGVATEKKVVVTDLALSPRHAGAIATTGSVHAMQAPFTAPERVPLF